MIYRNFKQLSTGQWLNVLMTVDGDEFAVKAADHRDQIAAGWGIAPADLEALDGPADARTGALLPGPIIVPTLDPNVEAIKGALPIWETLTATQRFDAVKSALIIIIKDKS